MFILMEANLKTLRSTLLTTVAAVIATVGFSSTHAKAQANFRNSVYFGGEIGWLNDDYKIREYRQNEGFNYSVAQSKSNDDNAFLPGIFLGYRHMFNCYLLGFDLSAHINSTSAHVSFVDATTNITSHVHAHGHYNILPTLVFGKTWNDKWSLYMKAGFDIGQYHFRFYDTDGQSKRKHEKINRGVLGLGMEYALNRCWSVRGEYVYSFKNGRDYDVTAAARANNTYHTKVKVASSALKFGVFVKY